MTIRNHLSGQRQSNRSQKSSPTAAKLWREFSLDAQCQKQENQRKSLPSYFADTTLAYENKQLMFLSLFWTIHFAGLTELRRVRSSTQGNRMNSLVAVGGSIICPERRHDSAIP